MVLNQPGPVAAPGGPGGTIGPHVRDPVYRGFMTTKRVQRRRGPRPATRVDLLALTDAAGTMLDEPPFVA